MSPAPLASLPVMMGGAYTATLLEEAVHGVRSDRPHAEHALNKSSA